MFGYGKMSSCAIASMSALAEAYPRGGRLSSLQIAKSRNMAQPMVAKILTILSQHGLVQGARGPGGGYQLADDPAKTSLHDVVMLFEGHQNPNNCPFGPGWCGVGEPCPLHDDLMALGEATTMKLKTMHFGDFVHHPKHLYSDDSNDAEDAPKT